MKNLLLKTSAVCILTSSVLTASGWRIPEQNPNSVALSGAFVANASGASSSYFNPANMSFNENTQSVEASLMAIKLTPIKYTDTRSATLNSESKSENFIIPSIFYTSKDYNGVRYGFSMTAPGGLSKRWESSFAKTSAEEFTLKIVELNPVVSYRVKDNFSVAAGFRLLYSEGVVKSNGTLTTVSLGAAGNGTTTISRDMEGDTIEYGYNLALSYKPTEVSNVSVTYRSKVDLNEEGTATLKASNTTVNAAPANIAIAASTVNTSASVSVPLPAVLAIATSYDFGKTTVEFAYDKTYWSAYKELDFGYGAAITNPVLKAAFDDTSAKNWKDTNAFRIGVSHMYSDKLTLMAGFAIDENPAPEESIGFELPDSDAKLYSFGFDYKANKTETYGFGYLYDQKEVRTVVNDKINGEFKDASAHLVAVSYKLNF